MEPFEFKLPRLGLGYFTGWAKHCYAAFLLFAAGALDYAQYVAASDGPQLAWVNLILFIVVIVLNEYLGPKPQLQDAKPGGVGDFSFPTATEGRTIPLLWGTNKIAGPNTIWYGDIEALPIRQRVQTGLWSSTKFTRGFFYLVGVQMAICRGPGVELLQAFAGDKEVFNGSIVGEGTFTKDDPNLFGGNDLGTGGLECTVHFYPGSKTQTVNTYLNDVDRQIISGVTTTVPRYIGTSHVVLHGLTGGTLTQTEDRGAYVGISTQVKPWSFVVRRIPALFPGQGSGENLIGTDDANPVNVLYEILTNDEWGLGFLPGDVDTGPGSTFVLAADECITEANGFSLLLERSMQAVDLVSLVEQQIDGLIYMNPTTGKWALALARATVPWTPASPRNVNESNSRFREYTRGSWEDTANEVQVKYWKRTDEYKESHVVAQDMANMQIQGAGSVQTGLIRTNKITMPGIKTEALANSICWRFLRLMSFPLARVTFELDRSFWDVRPGEVIHWSNDTLGLINLPMRISTVNFGTVEDGFVECNAVQDIFKFAAPSYGDPGGTNWVEPTLNVVAFPSDQQLVIDSPRAITVRDPDFSGDDTIRKVFVAARKQGVEALYDIRQRNAAGAPAGSFAFAGDVAGFIFIGELDAALGDGSAYPLATLTLNSTPDAQSTLVDAFAVPVTLADMGQQLTYLCIVGNEFILVSAAANGAGLDVDLSNVYRGVLDSVQGNHAVGTKVYMLFAGAGVTDTNFPVGNQIDIKLIPKSAKDELAEGSATTVNINPTGNTSKRVIRPYPPSSTLYNGAGSPFGTPSLEGAGSGLNGFRIDIDWRRRRYNTGDELAELLADFTPLASTEYEVEMRVDPTGSNTLVATKAWTTGTGTENFTRLDILDKSSGTAVGEELEVRIAARHDINAETDLESRQTFTHRFTPTSSLTGQFAFGKVTWSNAFTNYTAAATGTFTVNIGTSYTTGAIEVSVNGGGFVSVIATGLVTGTFSANSGETITFRHAAQDAGPGTNFCELKDPSAVSVAYGLFLD